MPKTSLTPTLSWNESNDADLYDELAYTISYGTDPSELTNFVLVRKSFRN